MSTPATRAALAGVAAVTALVAAWLIPALSPIVIWPLLLVAPGWLVLDRLSGRIDTCGRLGLSVVLTVGVSTHLVFWVSHLAGGYGRGVVFGVATLLALGIPAAAWRGGTTLPRPWRVGSRGLATVALLAGAVVGTTLATSLWRVTATGVSSGGTNWSDLGVHLSIAETLNAGANFPPDVPYFAGEPLVYHWFADFHAAMLASAADAFSIPAMMVQSTVMAVALALLVGSLARRLVRSPRAGRVAALAALLAVLGGGLGYVRLVGDALSGLGSPADLIASTSYDNQWLTEWPYFRIPSVMGTGLLAHRATGVGLPMLVGAMLLLVTGLPTARQRASGWRDRPWLIGAAGTLGALLAPFHFFFFPVLPLLALIWVVAGRRIIDSEAPRNAAAFLGPYVMSLPFAIAPALQASGSGWLRPVAIWPSAPVADGPAAVAFFYATNLGVPFALALVALCWPRLPHRGLLAAWVIVLFAIPNVVQVSVVDFDMNKYFQVMWVAVGILAAWLMRRWPWPAVALVVAASIPSPMLAAAWTATSDLQVLTSGELEAAEWARDETEPGAVFVTDGWVNAFTDPAGRKRLTTFGPYIANLGYDPDERIGHVAEIYCGGNSGRSAELMRRYGASYVVDAGRPQPCLAPVDFATDPAFELAFDGSPRVWRLRD